MTGLEDNLTKDLFDAEAWRIVLSSLGSYCITSLAVAAGVGGGGMLVPLYACLRHALGIHVDMHVSASRSPLKATGRDLSNTVLYEDRHVQRMSLVCLGTPWYSDSARSSPCRFLIAQSWVLRLATRFSLRKSCTRRRMCHAAQ